MAHLENAERLKVERQEAFQNFTIFEDHLPDMGIDLFIQFSKSEFTLFPQLPIELQLQIWRFLPYKSQLFFFCEPDDYPGIWNLWDGVPNMKQLCGPPNPIGLQVNTQSRQETIHYYSVLFETTSGYRRYFDPYKDEILATSLFPRLANLPSPPYWYHFREICGEHWKGERSVQHLEIHDFEWCSDHHHSIPDFRGIRYCFQGLNKLIIYPRVRPLSFENGNLYDAKRSKDCYDFFRSEFTRAKDELKWGGYKIPDIEIVLPELD